MIFAKTLNQYMKELGCTAKQLSALSGISMTQLSRYRNGVCIPHAESKAIISLSRSLAYLAKEKGISSITEESVSSCLNAPSFAFNFNYDTFSKNLDLLIRILGINTTNLSIYCNLDPSTISRIRSGRQKPRDPISVVETISRYITNHYFGISDRRKISDMIGHPHRDFEDRQSFNKALRIWLSGAQEKSKENSFGLLDDVDSFDFSEFLRVRPFEKAERTARTFYMPSTKTYTGAKGMENGILEFLKSTAASPVLRDVIIYNDYPLKDYFQESEFVSLLVRTLASVLLKGIHVNIIHTIDRPIQELIMEMEALLPTYMSGMISSYYLDNSHPNAYHRLLMVSGNAVLVGESIAGYPENGRYVFYKADSELVHYRRQADQLLNHAKRLVNIYREDKKEELQQVLERDIYLSGSIKTYITSPPIYTIGDSLLNRILKHNDLSEAEIKSIFQFVEKKRIQIRKFLKKGRILETLAIETKTEFYDSPLQLAISDMFQKRDISYTYEEYCDHVGETERFAAEENNYKLVFDHAPTFRHIQIITHKGCCSVISKNKKPAVHFSIYHPKVVDMLFNFKKVLKNE